MAEQIHSSTVTSTTAGTVLSPTTRLARWVQIQAPEGNTGNVSIRGVGEAGGSVLGAGIPLLLAAMGDLPHYDLNKISMVPAVSGEGVSILWFGE